MSEAPDIVCTFGPDMMDNFINYPFYMTTSYAYFIPFLLSFIVLGKTIVSLQFTHVYLILTCLIIGDFCYAVDDAVFACKLYTPAGLRPLEWAVYAFVYGGKELQNYVLFIWLYMWRQTYNFKREEAELEELAK